MGNCMERCILWQQNEEKLEEQQEEGAGIKTSGFVVNDEKGKNNNRVKVVLTKEELKWLILQLNEKRGGMKLEQVLQEIERGREKVFEGWKPSLESILEAPEILEMEAR